MVRARPISRRLGHCLDRMRREDEGVAVIEFALILPFLLLIAFGAVDTAMLLHHSHRVEQGLELAGSYLAKAPDPDSSVATARNLALTGERTGGTLRVRGWTGSDIAISFRDEAGSYRNGARVVRLVSSHEYDSPLGFLETVLNRQFTVQGTHEARLG